MMLPSSEEKTKLWDWSVSQFHSKCLPCMRPWVQSSAQKKEKEEKSMKMLKRSPYAINIRILKNIHCKN
jgi:hypothetical protein